MLDDRGFAVRFQFLDHTFGLEDLQIRRTDIGRRKTARLLFATGDDANHQRNKRKIADRLHGITFV